MIYTIGPLLFQGAYFMEVPFLIKVFCIMAMVHDLAKLIFFNLSYEQLYYEQSKKEIVTERLSNYNVIMQLLSFFYLIFLVYSMIWLSSYVALLAVTIVVLSLILALLSMSFYKYKRFMVSCDIADSVLSLIALTLIAFQIF